MSDASTRLGAALALAAVLLAAVVVRAWGISAGLPYIRHPDEPVSITTMREMITRGVPIPDRFDYSSLSYYVNAAAYVPYLWLTGGVHRPSSELLPSVAAMGVARDPDPGATLLSRIITLLFGVATVGLAYALARRLGLGVLASAGAAAAVALNPDHVVHSRFVAPDVIATFFVT
ncbi:MAG: phospholipid carrier-dependent glycosyltransferase, partial [Actinobacteria bacterium]